MLPRELIKKIRRIEIVTARQAQNQLSVATQDLITRVAQSYFDVLLARVNLSTIRSQKTAVAEQLEQAKLNFIVGTATMLFCLCHPIGSHRREGRSADREHQRSDQLEPEAGDRLRRDTTHPTARR